MLSVIERMMVPDWSFLETFDLKEEIMRARLVSNTISSGHMARDYIRAVRERGNSAIPDMPGRVGRAHAVLESFDDHYKPASEEPGPPVKSLTTVLTNGLRGMPGLSREDGGIDAASLYRGCRVRVAGIPERLFVVHDIFWDKREVRIKEMGRGVEYVLPLDCLRLAEEQQG